MSILPAPGTVEYDELLDLVVKKRFPRINDMPPTTKTDAKEMCDKWMKALISALEPSDTQSRS